MRVGLASIVAMCMLAGCEKDGTPSDPAPDNAPAASRSSTGARDANRPPPDPPEDSDIEFTEVPLLRLLSQQETVLIRSLPEWDEYAARAAVHRWQTDVSPDDPHCDFACHMLVIYCFQPYNGCPWTYEGVSRVFVLADTIVVRADIDHKHIPIPEGAVDDCAVVNVHDGFAVRIPQSDLPVTVQINWY